jgi:G3E family GTPase
MNAIPILLLTGYLGSGKTTLLNHLLQLPSIRDRKLALVINEFGKMGIDGALVDSGSHAKFEINRGSLFCACTAAEMVKTFRILAGEIEPDLILIEATGIAEPREVMSFCLDPELGRRFTVQANLCLVDANTFIKVLPMLSAVRKQVLQADGIVLNKIDLTSCSEVKKVEEILQSLNRDAPIAKVDRGKIPEGFLLSLRHRPGSGDLLLEPPDHVFAESFEVPHLVDKARFLQALEDLKESILRLKGHLDFGEGPRFVEVVVDEYQERPATPNARTTGFTVIAWKKGPGEIRARIEEALALL